MAVVDGAGVEQARGTGTTAGSRRARRPQASTALTSTALVVTVLGIATAAAGALLLCLAPVLAVIAGPAGMRERTVRAARRLAAVDRRRVARLPGAADVLASPDRHPVAFLLARVPGGLLGGAAVLAGLGGGAVYAVASPVLLVQGRFPLETAAAGVGLGVVTIAVAVQVAGALARWDRYLCRRLLGADPAEALRRRVVELTTSRAEVVAAVDEERRRIERDLHDGVQQRLVALGMLLGRARRAGDGEHARALAAQAHDETQDALRDLRELVWRVYPSVLDEAGLRAAVDMVADRSGVPVEVSGDVHHPLPPGVRTAAYFVVCEAVTNAAKHAAPTRVQVVLDQLPDRLSVRVVDDGRGGADPSGGGLRGLARRVAALDGHLVVSSPPGGPTSITAEIPCG